MPSALEFIIGRHPFTEASICLSVCLSDNIPCYLVKYLGRYSLISHDPCSDQGCIPCILNPPPPQRTSNPDISGLHMQYAPSNLGSSKRLCPESRPSLCSPTPPTTPTRNLTNLTTTTHQDLKSKLIFPTNLPTFTHIRIEQMADRGSHRGGGGGGGGRGGGNFRGRGGGRGGHHGPGRGGGGHGGSHHNQHSQGGQGEGEQRPKKENILDLSKYSDKRITVKFNGGREGTLFFPSLFSFF